MLSQIAFMCKFSRVEDHTTINHIQMQKINIMVVITQNLQYLIVGITISLIITIKIQRGRQFMISTFFLFVLVVFGFLGLMGYALICAGSR